MEDAIAQFVGVTGATARDARKYLDKYNRRVDVAIDAYYNDPNAHRPSQSSGSSTSKLNQLFDTYKDADGDEITVDGTIKMCEDLAVDPEDVVMLAVAFELRSPRMAEWTRQGWTEGWKRLGCDNIAAMKVSLLKLRDKLGSDAPYFQQVYNYAFEFSRPENQRSLAMETAQGLWTLLIPHGLQGGALSHKRDDGDDDAMGVDEDGWQEGYLDWWFEYLTSKGSKGVSKDMWYMFLEFVRTIDADFQNYDAEAAWPSSIDDFVDYAKQRVASGN
ncbi:defective in Cullin neddylation protein 1 [Cytidiella melzeri]|nr:defective in Cullin neddylation protein 1 [Cytidiella melzeri]